ncbi:Utp14-domain-containing protein [Lentinula aciculospora]|uniref:Utp14-domain-containing protein n=1 Tax=Lentinula aciculospora TaxID=153920 RepID=A0A9W9A2L6_9AGAR|nr:Utp14-domain-containing protein [Lentinula aciculospora]
MARSGRPSSNHHSRPKFRDQAFAKHKSSAFAASGYAKRQARKEAKSAGRSEDVYEYSPDKIRRSKIALDLDREEEMDAGPSFPDLDDDMDDFRLKARLIGENEEDERIDSADDEEIDSDDAFDEEDDERFAGFFSKKNTQALKKKATKKASVKFADVNLNEDDDHAELQEFDQDGKEAEHDEDDEESGEDDDYINVLDILDGRGEPINDEESDAPSTNLRKKKLSVRGSDEEMGAGEDEDGESVHDEEEHEAEAEDDGISISLSEAEGEAAGALDDLQTFISSLDPTSSATKKRKADGVEPEQPRKRRVVQEITEAGVESEFRTQSAGLSLNDLLAPLGQSSLEKSVKVLQSSGGDPSSGKKKKPQTLSVPLPQRTQERLDREAAYEQTKVEVDKWSAAMKRISEADHLSFPLQAQPQGKVSNLELAAKFKPTTALENTISSLLTSANLATDASVLETEENILKATAISVEDVADRRRELRRMRELMFRAEVKAKRVKKIKSKVYRRLKRKEKEAVDGHDNDGDEELTEEHRLKMEMERARERATLKHKNTGKWAKKMMSRGGYREGDDGDDIRSGRQEIEEMLSRGEKLRRKIQGGGSDDDASQSEDDDEEEEDPDAGVESAFNELRALTKDDHADSVESEGKKGKSVFEMKFMKDAMARRQTETNRSVDDFIKEMGGDEGQHSDSEAEFTQDHPAGFIVSRTGGRIVLKPAARGSENPTRTFSVASIETSSSTLKSTDFPTPMPPSPLTPTLENPPSRAALCQPLSSKPAKSTAPVNPWLVASESNGPSKAARKKNEVVMDKDSSQTTKSKHKLSKQTQKAEEEKTRAKNDALVEIEMDTVLVNPDVPKTLEEEEDASGTSMLSTEKKSRSKTKIGKTQTPLSSGAISDGDSDGGESEVEEQEKMLQMKGKKAKTLNAFEQRELVARAFAGDNVVKEFEEAKQREIAMDAPAEVDTTLPGWGSWGGNGVHKAAPRPHLIKKIAGIDPKSRADYNKSHVIISEKRDKKAAKYQVPDLPYPYTSKAQFDRRMQQPLGPEWNTRVGFQRGTLPKVMKKMGTIIDPLEKVS